ncbi:MAG: hypothetical protein KC516_03485 [Nanoarchaeota archaeon]|nr:hypothetical protein [Nanoarchaeota archaeon]
MEKKEIDFRKQGKKNKQAGLRFEAKVREDLTNLGWIVDKWMNTVEKDKEGLSKIVPAKRKYNPFKKVMVLGTGFPDFIAFKKIQNGFDVVGIEVKSNGYLDQVEKGMCLWLLENRIFSRILIAKKKINGRKIEVDYDDFDKKYAHKF